MVLHQRAIKSSFVYVYFITVIIIGCYIIMKLFVAIIINNFEEANEKI